jgi:hypothetical protein
MKKNEIIGIIGVVLTLAGIIVSLYIPEVRSFLGIDEILKDNDWKSSSTTLQISKGKDEPLSSYGIGYGKITIYNECHYAVNTSVFIDGNKVGILEGHFEDNSNVSCGIAGTISQIIRAGNHIIKAEDEDHRTWSLSVIVKEGSCSIYGLTCSNVSNLDTNPYGYGNGKISIYTSCPDGGTTTVFVDGILIGKLDTYYNDSLDVECGDSGTVSKILKVGKHIITAEDESNRTWKFDEYIQEGICDVQCLSCK